MSQVLWNTAGCRSCVLDVWPWMPQLPMLLNLESELESLEFIHDDWILSIFEQKKTCMNHDENFWTDSDTPLFRVGLHLGCCKCSFIRGVVLCWVLKQICFSSDNVWLCLVNLIFGINIFPPGFNAKEHSLLNLRAALVKGILEEWSHFMFCLGFFTWKMVAQPIFCSQDPAVLETVAKDPVTYGCHVLYH